MTHIVQAFQYGEEVAIVFPKEFKIKPDQKFKVTKDKDEIIFSFI